MRAIEDVLGYMVQAAERPEAAGREIQIGGADVLTYSQLLDLMADVLGKRRRPKVPVPLLTPRLSSQTARRGRNCGIEGVESGRLRVFPDLTVI